MSVPDSAQLILASASPRRRELLDQIGVCYRVRPVDLDEAVLDGEPPADYVQRLAREKAAAGFFAGGYLLPALGADTAVVCGEEIFGKPIDRDDALRMLKKLSGATHQVYSAVAICDAEICVSELSISHVTFDNLSVQQLENYWASGEPQGKAGAYAIQGLAATFVVNLQGSYSGVVGLPLWHTAQLLKRFSVPFSG